MLPRMVAYRRQQANEDRQFSHVGKGVIMDLIVIVIGTGGNAAEAGVFYSVLWDGPDLPQCLDCSGNHFQYMVYSI